MKIKEFNIDGILSFEVNISASNNEIMLNIS